MEVNLCGKCDSALNRWKLGKVPGTGVSATRPRAAHSRGRWDRNTWEANVWSHQVKAWRQRKAVERAREGPELAATLTGD